MNLDPKHIGLNVAAFVLAFGINRACTTGPAMPDEIEDSQQSEEADNDADIRDHISYYIEEDARTWLAIDPRARVGPMNNGDSRRYVLSLFGSGALTVNALIPRGSAGSTTADGLVIQLPGLRGARVESAAIAASGGIVRPECVTRGRRLVLIDFVCD